MAAIPGPISRITRVCPKELLGKIGVAVSPAKEDRVYAVVEAEDGAVFRSDDGGAHWQRLCEERSLRQRAWYYHHIIADPRDADTVWVLNVQCWRSIDGGKSLRRGASAAWRQPRPVDRSR